MRVAFFGSGAFGVPTLARLADAHELALVVTQPDRPAGRGRELTPTPVGAWTAARGPGPCVMKPENVNAPEAVEAVRALAGPGRVDAWVVIAFGQKLSAALLEGVRAMNLHASLLPRWRGAAPIHAAIRAGDAETGNSVITLAQRMDAGLVLGQSRRAIEPSQTAGELHDLLSEDGPALVLGVLERWGRGDVGGLAQDEALATRAPKLSKADDAIDFGLAAPRVRANVHGLTPWPGMTIKLERPALEAKLLRVEAIEAASAPASAPPGTLVDATAGVVACGHGTALAIREIQPAGGRAMSWPEFARGRGPAEGQRLTSARSVP